MVETRRWRWLIFKIFFGEVDKYICVFVLVVVVHRWQKWKTIMWWWRRGRLGKCSNSCYWCSCSHRGQRKQPGQFDHEEWTQFQDGGMKRLFCLEKSRECGTKKTVYVAVKRESSINFPIFVSPQCLRYHTTDINKLKMFTRHWPTNTHHSRMINGHDKSIGGPCIGIKGDWKKSIWIGEVSKTATSIFYTATSIFYSLLNWSIDIFLGVGGGPWIDEFLPMAFQILLTMRVVFSWQS